MMQNKYPSIISQKINDKLCFKVVDNSENILEIRRIKKIFLYYEKDNIFYDFKNRIIDSNANYVKINSFIEKLSHKLNSIDSKLIIDSDVRAFFKKKSYDIKNQRRAGETIKNNDNFWTPYIEEFNKVVSNEIERPLKDEQIRASFFLTKMKRAANFSVPGTGKTATMYGTYAYLSSEKENKVNKILVVCPLNSFESWRYEFEAVFGRKRKLHYMNLKNKIYSEFGRIRSDWGMKNLIVINYEGLPKVLNVLNELIDEQTMLVFDEVHRIKGIKSTRARVALQLGEKANYRYVLTGTPIPNGYEDIYNFLNILFKDEYNSYFKWRVNQFDSLSSDEVTEKLYPFFWRTTKKDLNVPLAENDKLILVEPSFAQSELANLIYKNEPGILAIYIRLIQASTNPALVLQKIDDAEQEILDKIDDNININSALDAKEKEAARRREYEKLNVLKMKSPKFERGN